MKSIDDEKDFFSRLVKNISMLLGGDCEVVLHDFTRGYESTILQIENGHVTGREAGGCPTNLFFELFQNSRLSEDMPVYFNTLKNGKVLKSSTTLIKDDKGNILGSICINLNVSDLILAGNTIRNLSGYGSEQSKDEIFVRDVTELLEYYLESCQKIIGKPAILMNREERLRAIEYLDKRGVFLITKSSNKICDCFNISKFTLYNYLDEIRNPDNK